MTRRMKPNSRPQATREDVLKYLDGSGVKLDNVAVLVSVRGYYLNTMGVAGRNDINIYDDAMFLLTPTRLAAWNANTDPSRSGRKLAMLVPQVIPYYRGKHRGRYDALRPFPEGVRLRCTRDGVPSMCSHTNIHRGGTADTFSEGCQTIPPDQYENFISDVYATMSLFRQQVINCVLVENK